MSKFFKCFLVCLLLLGLCACQAQQIDRSHDYMQAIGAYYTALAENRFTSLRQAMPAQVLDSLGLDAGELTNLVSKYNRTYGQNFTAIVSENGSVRLSKQQLDDLEAYLAQQYGIREAVQDAYLVEYTTEFSGIKSEKSTTEGIVVYQLDDNWYIDLQADATIESIRQLYNN